MGNCRGQSEEQNWHEDREPCLAILSHPGESMQITRVLKLQIAVVTGTFYGFASENLLLESIDKFLFYVGTLFVLDVESRVHFDHLAAWLS